MSPLTWMMTFTPLYGTVTVREMAGVGAPRAVVPTMVSCQRPGLRAALMAKVPSGEVPIDFGCGPGLPDGPGDVRGDPPGVLLAGAGVGVAGGRVVPGAAGGPRYVVVNVTVATSTE